MLNVEHAVTSPIGYIFETIAMGDIDVVALFLLYEYSRPDSFWCGAPPISIFPHPLASDIRAGRHGQAALPRHPA